MPVRTQISLIVTVVPVGPRARRLADQYFALQLATAYQGGEQAPGDDPELKRRELLPWLWNWSGRRLTLVAARTTEAGEREYAVFRPELIDEARTPRLADGVAETTQSWVSLRNSAHPANGRNERSAAEEMAFLATFPGQTGQALRLTRYFKVGAAESGEAFTDPELIEQFVVAPEVGLEGADGAVSVFTPRLPFPFLETATNWKDGWGYVDAEQAADLRLARARPVVVERAADSPLRFDEEPAERSFGLNFHDYWIRSRNTQPWTDEIEQRCAEATQFTTLMSHADDLLHHPDPTARKAWENLRLMALGLFSQWPEPSAEPESTGNDADLLVNYLREWFSPKLTVGEEGALRGSLRALRSQLRKREGADEVWLEILKLALDAPLEEALQRADEPQLHSQMLFWQWNYAALKADASVAPGLAAKWLQAAGSDDFRRLFINPSDFGWGAEKRALREQAGLRLRIAEEAQGEDAPAQARDLLIQHLKELSSRLDLSLWPDYFPNLIDRGVMGESLWERVWQGESQGATRAGGWNGLVERFMNDAWAGLIAPPRTEKTPSGLTIQLDRAQKHNQVAAEDRSGPLFFWNKVAGVGLLVRPHGGQWRLASAATVRLRGVRVKRVYRLDGDAEDSLRAEVETYPNAWAGIYNVTVGNKTAPNLFAVTDTDVTVASSKLIEITPNTAPRGWNGVVKITVKDGHFNGGILPVVTFGEIFTQAATVPVRAHFRKNNELSDHIRYPFITYNQRSLIAASPLGDATRDAFTASNENPEAQQAVTFYEYDAVLDPNPSDLKLTPLRFGRRYQMAAFMIDLAGGLPRELAKTYPWVGLTEGLNAPEDAEVIQDFHYWRRVPIGQVRLSAIRNDSARWEAVNWPSLPEQCAPLSKELEAGGRIELTPEAEGRQLALLAETGRHSPVIGNEFIFGLRPPSVELAALERWGIESVPNAPASKKVLASYYRRLNRRQNTLPANAPLPTPDDDISLDDPAVTAYLITLETFDWETGGWGTPKGRIVLVSARAKGDDIGYFQQDWLRVRCVSGDSAQIEPTPSDEAPQEIKITIPQREATVARIQTHALAPKELVEGATARFPSDFFPSYAAPGGLSPDIVAKLEAYICLAPQTVVVETTNPDLPDPVELWQTLRARRQSDQSIALHLSPSVDAGPELAALFRNVMRCDLIKQVWRWQGRPLRPLPFAPEDWPDEAANIDDSAHVLRWEESAFAELDDLFDSLTIPLSYPLSLSSAQNEAPLYTDRPGGQKLAFYLRYAARVYSRYEPLYPDDARSQLSQQSVALKEGTALLTGPGWRRAFLPYRGGKPVKPVIKAIVPLTDGLAEMSELWLLAEREISPSPLLARLQAEQDPDTPGTCIRRRWQADSYLEERAAALLAEGASWPEAKLRRELCRLLNSLLDGDLYTGGERCWDSYLTESEVATLRQAGQLPAHELCRLNRQILLARAFKNEIMAPRDDQAAPLLIVVDEAMMAQAGITESLACRIESVSPPGGQMSLYQLGHDPILNLTAPDPGAPLLHRLIGPFGYTFDTDARQSLFNSSSYFLRPFGGAERWDFAQISLRRLTGDPELDQRGVDDTSGEEWTKPVWVQFVPPSTFGLSFDQLEVNSTPVGEAEQEVTITFRGSSFEAHALDWQGKYFTYGVLLTRRICDFRGHSGSEVYLTACGAAIAAAEQDAQISFLLPREWPETELVVRLIEVQETPHYDDTPRADVRENRGQGFWDRLFRTTPGANGDLEDAESRVTRLSPPFTIKQPKAE